MTIAQATGKNMSGSKKRLVHQAARNVLTQYLADCDAPKGDRLVDSLDRFQARLGSLLDECSAAPAPKPVVLKLVNASVQLDAIASYDPKGFKTRKGLWVSDDFQSRVGKKAKPVKDLPAITLTSGDLVKNAYDKEIKADPVMPANHVFESESDFVAHLDQMVSKQPNGEEGDLLNNGYWNIFYVAGCVVSVFWRSDNREWNVGTWNLDGDLWGAGDRAFGCN